jgi:hypothetical protein
MNMLRCKSLAFSVWFCSWLLASRAFAVRLEYKVKVSDSWKLKTSMKGSGTADIDVMGQQQSLPVEMEIVSTSSQKVTAVTADGTFETAADYKLDTMKAMIAGMELPIPMPPEGKPITSKITKLGKVVEIKGLDSGAQGGPGIDFNRIFGALPTAFPDKDLNVGDAWQVESQKDAPLSYKMKGKLLSVENGVAKVEYKIEMPIEAIRQFVKQQAGQVDIKLGGKGMSGTMTTLVNLSNGTPAGGDGTMEIDMEMEVAGQFKMHQVMKMTMKIELVM